MHPRIDQARRRQLNGHASNASETTDECDGTRIPIDGHLVIPNQLDPYPGTENPLPSAYPSSSETDSDIHPRPPVLTLREAAEIGIM